MRLSGIVLLIAGIRLGSAAPAAAQVRVNPTGVNVNAQGATTVFLTYGGLAGHAAAEAFWCGELVAAAPAIGFRCDPATLFGQLPFRYDLATPSGTNALTDIMTIPPSVARRAYQAAAAGAVSSFFYVRRFTSLSGGPDQYVAVTCRMTGGGARTPLSLTDVRLAFEPEVPVLQVAQGTPMPALGATIGYTGTGRLTGRWEIVLPGEELPTAEDLLTEATLPPERRGTQRRYAQISRFNVFLPPTGRIVLPGPDPARLPTVTDGVYHLLLRIEVSAEKEGNSDLAAVGAGDGVVAGGAVAGFPMPVLRYVVGSGGEVPAIAPGAGEVLLLAPSSDAVLNPATPPVFTWQPLGRAALYRIEFEADSGGQRFAALVPEVVAGYRAPPFLATRIEAGAFRWRVVAIDLGGRELGRSAWRHQGWEPVP